MFLELTFTSIILWLSLHPQQIFKVAVFWSERRPEIKLKKNANRNFLGDFFNYNKYNRDNFESEIKFGMLKKC